MISITKARQLALAFEEAEELPHFEKASFRIRKKIFATLDEKKNQLVIKLSQVDQSVFQDWNKDIIFPVPGGWGQQGWTIIDLKKVPVSVFKDALSLSYCQTAPAQLAAKYLK